MKEQQPVPVLLGPLLQNEPQLLQNDAHTAYTAAATAGAAAVAAAFAAGPATFKHTRTSMQPLGSSTERPQVVQHIAPLLPPLTPTTRLD